MRQPYKHIIWDWNGTLLDDAWLSVSVMNRLLAQRNLPTLTLETYRAVFAFPVRGYCQALGFDFEQQSFEDLSIEFIAQYEARRHECALAPAAVAVLTRIAAAGIGQSILSAYRQDDLVNVIDHFGLAHFFERLIGLGDIYAASKVELGRSRMRELGHAQAEVLLIGDTVHDFEVAQAIGAACMLVAGGHNSSVRLQSCGVPVVAALPELLALFA